MGAQTQHKARPQVGRPNAMPQKRKARPREVRNAMQGTSQDGRPNAKLIRNENVHTREH
jgi:hypothetical protein